MASVSPARLSSLSTATLTRILELTRARQLIDAPPPPASLSTRITNDLGSLHAGITALEADPSRRRVPTEPRDADAEAKEEMLSGLKGQYGRLVGLARDLGLEARDIAEEEATEESDLPAARLTRTPMPASNVRIDLDDQGDADEDEEAMKRANQDVMMMQRGMIDQQDETLDKLSLAISRQRDLSLTISSELELHSSLLDETDEAVDRTGGQLRRARGRLEHVSKKARDNGATCTIIALVVILLLLIVLLK